MVATVLARCLLNRCATASHLSLRRDRNEKCLERAIDGRSDATRFLHVKLMNYPTKVAFDCKLDTFLRRTDIDLALTGNQRGSCIWSYVVVSRAELGNQKSNCLVELSS